MLVQKKVRNYIRKHEERGGIQHARNLGEQKRRDHINVGEPSSYGNKQIINHTELNGKAS